MDIKDVASPDDIKPAALDFIYKNAVAYLESIHKSMESISNRSLVLLSYLMLVVGYMASRLISHIIGIFEEIHVSSYDFILILLGLLLMLYYIWIIWDIVHYSKPRWANIGYSQPDDILGSELNSYGEHMMKFVRCIELQEDIKENMVIMTDMFYQFEKAIDRAFIFPALLKVLRKQKL